ncbi:YigZ family protein [Flavobacterium sp. J27]|uniref:IMPACT family protein n=1 Tax=Flavobacterium sp. J27 TaxID=2060419 RepID=UPI00103163B3|nr:YigZ family protein [Flavobacterium sp. J27]
MNNLNSDIFKTIASPSEEVLYKEKNSKFFGYAYPVTNENEVKELILELKKLHHNARHWCYAFQIGAERPYYRVNDDGEPNNSAGTPIYGQIQSFEVTNILIVVVRYFGGVKLGVGGLISAYKTAAQMALENASIIEKTIDIHFLITFDYKNMNKVMRVIKEQQLQIISQKMEMNCQIEIATRKQNEEKVYEIFESLYEIEIKKLDL